MKKFNAFTLAEVLVTLGVIGVISAMTLPTVFSNYQKTVTVNKLKKMYSNLNSIMQMAVNDNGDMETWDIKGMNHITSDNEFYLKYIFPYLKIIKSDFHVTTEGYERDIYNMNGTKLISLFWQILPDGTSISLFFGPTYKWIFVDINGPKLPNMLGKDVFMMDLNIHKNSLVFWQYYGCKKETNEAFAGGACGHKIMDDGWKIKEDYPW